MLKKLENLVDQNGKPIFIMSNSKTEDVRKRGRIAGKRFFNTFSQKKQ